VSSGLNYYYTTVVPRPGRWGITTSPAEVRQILIAYAVITLDLVIIFSGSSFVFGSGSAGLSYALTPGILGIAATAAFTGFVAHELAHKIVAQRRGFWAEFRMWPAGLALSVVMSLVGFLWGAPGATVVGGMSESNRTDWGKTSVAGPLTNLSFGLVFLAGGLVTFELGSPIAAGLLLLAWINGLFGTFNLIPLGPLDGRKVLSWSAVVWAGAFLASFAFVATATLGVYSLQGYGTPFHYYQAIARGL